MEDVIETTLRCPLSLHRHLGDGLRWQQEVGVAGLLRDINQGTDEIGLIGQQTGQVVGAIPIVVDRAGSVVEVLQQEVQRTGGAIPQFRTFQDDRGLQQRRDRHGVPVGVDRLVEPWSPAVLPALGWVALLVSVFLEPAGADEALVVRDEVVARSADSQRAPSRFPEPLPGGTEVRIIEERDAWTHIRLANGRDAWVDSGSLTRLIPAG